MMQKMLRTSDKINLHLNYSIGNLTSNWAYFLKNGDKQVSRQEIEGIADDNMPYYETNAELTGYQTVNILYIIQSCFMIISLLSTHFTNH